MLKSTLFCCHFFCVVLSVWFCFSSSFTYHLPITQKTSNNSCSPTTVTELSGSSTHDSGGGHMGETEGFGCKISPPAGDQITQEREKCSMTWPVQKARGHIKTEKIHLLLSAIGYALKVCLQIPDLS